MLLPPGSTACSSAGLRGGTEGPNRSLAETQNHFAPRLGVAWDVHGNGKMALRAGVGRFVERESLQNGLNLGFNPPFNRTLLGSRTLDSNAEPFPDAFNEDQGIPQFGVDTSGRMGYNWQWNVSAQREVAHNTTLEVGYVGSKGQDLLLPYDASQVPPGDNNHNGVPDRLDFVRAGSSSSARAALRPYGVFGNAGIAILDHGGSTIYHSLQTQIVSRFGHGSQFQASYTFSRTIGDVSLIGGENSLGASSVSLLEDRSLDRGLAAAHRKHIANGSLILVLPLRRQGGFAVPGMEIGNDASPHRTSVTVFTAPFRVSPTVCPAPGSPPTSGDAWPSSPPRERGLPEQILNPLPSIHRLQLGPSATGPRWCERGPTARWTRPGKVISGREMRSCGSSSSTPSTRQLHRGQHEPESDERDPGQPSGRRRIPRSPVGSFGRPRARAPAGQFGSS